MRQISQENRHRPARIFAWVYFFWIPLVAVVYPYLFRGMQSSWKQWAISVVVSATAFTGSYGGIFVVAAAERALYAARKLSPPAHGRLFGFITAALLMPFATFTGLVVAAWIFGFDTPDLSSIADMKGSLLIGLSFMTVFVLVQTFSDLKEAAARAENERLKAQLSALTAQMNPHLLFNALNTIASLTQTNADAAEAMTVRLAELYRGVLDASRSDRHSLSAELALCRAYLEIEQARFGDRLQFAIDNTEEAECLPLSLQLLVENAVKHGIAPLERGGRVDLAVRRQGGVVQVTVADTGAGFSAVKKPESTALDNLRARLKLAYGDAGKLEISARDGGGTVVTIGFPG